MTQEEAARWADEILDADYPKKTLKLRIANCLVDAAQQATFKQVAFWQAVQVAHERSAMEHADNCSNGSECSVYLTKMHIAGLIEAQLLAATTKDR